MRVLLAALVAVLSTAPSAWAQAASVGVDDDPVMGAATAKVTIIEFGDYQCASCRQFWRDVEPSLKKDYIDTGKVKLVYRDFPIIQIHPEATLAAMAAQCANDQGQYWQMHDRIFREQDTRGAGLIRFSANDLKQWAKDARLDPVAFDACLDSENHLLEVGRDYTDGLKAGVNGTPTFFINGQVIAGPQPYATFRSLIEKLLAP